MHHIILVPSTQDLNTCHIYPIIPSKLFQESYQMSNVKNNVIIYLLTY